MECPVMGLNKAKPDVVTAVKLRGQLLSREASSSPCSLRDHRASGSLPIARTHKPLDESGNMRWQPMKMLARVLLNGSLMDPDSCSQAFRFQYAFYRSVLKFGLEQLEPRTCYFSLVF